MLTVAIDAQGSEVARPWVEKAGATYRNAVDPDNLLGRLYGVKAVPNCWLIDEQGIIRYQATSRFDIRRPEIAEALLDLLRAPSAPAERADSAQATVEEDAFQQGVQLWKQGRKREAVERWLAALEADPENFLIRKQIWYVLHPEQFAPEVDFTWQREQMAREREVGFQAGNPIPADW